MFKTLLMSAFVLGGTFTLSVPAMAQQAPAATVDLKEYDHLDPKNIVPEKPLRQALTYFKTHQDTFPNKDYIVVIDYSRPSSQKRMFVINMKTGEVDAHLTSHGRGSDPKNTGVAQTFSNKDESHMTSLGIFRTQSTYTGKHGLSLKLEGLSPTNSNALDRKIVIHAANYVDEDSRHVGRSHGCPAVDPQVLNPLIRQIKNGAMIYSWAGGN